MKWQQHARLAATLTLAAAASCAGIRPGPVVVPEPGERLPGSAAIRRADWVHPEPDSTRDRIAQLVDLAAAAGARFLYFEVPLDAASGGAASPAPGPADSGAPALDPL
ncbi:MAG: hypothetical protein ABIL09_05520, partial [Gemmatimonadota bacterium]